MGEKLVMNRWRYYCEIRKKMISTRSQLPEDLIKGEHPDAVPIEGSRREIDLVDDPWMLCTSNILRGYTPPSQTESDDEKKPPEGG